MRNGLIIDEHGAKRYYLNDKLHREDGPAVEWKNGNKWWYRHGRLHREDGPAFEEGWDGSKYWYINGERHREDGPAIEFANGVKFYYLNNIEYSEEDFWEEIKKRKSLNFILKNYFKTRRTFSNISFPIVRRVFSQLIQKDFISIQPMELPSSIFFFEYTYDSNPSIDSSIQDNSCVINETENVNICS